MFRHLTTSAPRAGFRALAAIIVVSGLAACSSDDGGLDANPDSSEAEDQADPDAVSGDGVVGEGTLTITLDDGMVFPFDGDCEISVEGAQTKYLFNLESPEGELAGARHTVNEDLGAPTSIQFTDDDLNIYFGSSFSDTTVDGNNWASDVVVESQIDGEPFSATGRVESTCT